MRKWYLYKQWDKSLYNDVEFVNVFVDEKVAKEAYKKCKEKETKDYKYILKEIPIC